MKQEFKIIIIGFAIIALFDAVSSIASRQLNFNYSFLAAFSFFIYGVSGFIGAKKRGLKTGVLIAAAIGLFDSTIGWKISMLLGANAGKLANNPNALIWIFTALFVTGSAALLGLIGGWLATVLKKKPIDQRNVPFKHDTPVS